jgi:hypothetical protein
MSYRQVEKMIKNEGYDNIKCLNVVIVIWNFTCCRKRRLKRIQMGKKL